MNNNSVTLIDLAVVTLTFKILSGPYLRKHKVKNVDSWMGHCLGSVGMLSDGVPFNFGSAKVCSTARVDGLL